MIIYNSQLIINQWSLTIYFNFNLFFFVFFFLPLTLFCFCLFLVVCLVEIPGIFFFIHHFLKIVYVYRSITDNSVIRMMLRHQHHTIQNQLRDQNRFV